MKPKPHSKQSNLAAYFSKPTLSEPTTPTIPEENVQAPADNLNPPGSDTPHTQPSTSSVTAVKR